MQLKYATELNRFPNCPPDNATPCDRQAFRFVHSELSDIRNFLPVAKLTPQRRLRPDMRCVSLALSFWATKDQAVAAHRSFREQFQNFEETAGGYLASGVLRHEDGRAGPDRRDGHFSFFESSTANFGPDRFSVVQELS